jgi:hypothetical protein
MTELKSHFGLTNIDILKDILHLKSFLTQNVDLKSFGHQGNVEGFLFDTEKDTCMIGTFSINPCRKHIQLTISSKKRNYWNQDLKITDIGKS